MFELDELDELQAGSEDRDEVRKERKELVVGAVYMEIEQKVKDLVVRLALAQRPLPPRSDAPYFVESPC